jgi:Na+-driven multidrug efflux pump
VAMTTLILGMVTNIILDPLFIFGFQWGVAGAAWATLIGRAITVILIIAFYLRRRGTVHLTLRSMKPDWSVLREMASIGSSGFVRQVSTSTVQMFRNHLLVVSGGALFISAFGAVFRSITFLGMPSMGIAQALPPIAGYNYGAKNLDRVRQSLWVSIVSALVVTWTGFAFMQLAPTLLLRLFSSDPDYLARGVSIMRISSFALLAFPVTIMAPGFYQALGKSMRALILSLTRPVFALIVMIIAIRVGGPLGVVSADPIAIGLGTILCVVFLRSSLKQLESEKRHGEEGSIRPQPETTPS